MFPVRNTQHDNFFAPRAHRRNIFRVPIFIPPPSSEQKTTPRNTYHTLPPRKQDINRRFTARGRTRREGKFTTRTNKRKSLPSPRAAQPTMFRPWCLNKVAHRRDMVYTWKLPGPSFPSNPESNTNPATLGGNSFRSQRYSGTTRPEILASTNPSTDRCACQLGHENKFGRESDTSERWEPDGNGPTDRFCAFATGESTNTTPTPRKTSKTSCPAVAAAVAAPAVQSNRHSQPRKEFAI